MKKLDPQLQLPVHRTNGTIPAHSLEALAQIDHVVVVSAPHPLRPLLNDSADEIRALAVHPGNPGGGGADAAIPVLPMALLRRCRRRR